MGSGGDQVRELQEVDESLLANGATGLAFANKGVVMLNGEETYVERVARKALDSWKRERGRPEAIGGP